MANKAGYKIHNFLKFKFYAIRDRTMGFQKINTLLSLYSRLVGLNGKIHDANEPQVTGLPQFSQLVYEQVKQFRLS